MKSLMLVLGIPLLILLLSFFLFKPEPQPPIQQVDLDLERLVGEELSCQCGRVRILEADYDIAIDNPEYLCLACGEYPCYKLKLVPYTKQQKVVVDYEYWNETASGTLKWVLSPGRQTDLVKFGMVVEQAISNGSYKGTHFDLNSKAWIMLAVDWFNMLGFRRSQAAEFVDDGLVPWDKTDMKMIGGLDE